MHKIVNCRVLSASMLIWQLVTNATSAANLTASQLNAILKDAGVKVSAISTIVMGNGPLVTVLAEEDAKTADQDLKIDALFLSKALMEAAPAQIEKVKVLFSQSGHEGRYIIVDNREIQDFGHGKISPEKMLLSMHFSDVEPERAPDVVPGDQFERRLLVWNRIKRLRQQGTGVSPFENIFKEIESAAKAGDSAKVGEKVAYLESKLSDQEEQVKQAKKSAQGRGVPSIASRTSTAPQGAGAQTSVSAFHGTGYVPPDADRIKRINNQDSENWIRYAESKNSSQVVALRKLKKSVDEKFAAKQEAAAFEELGNMVTIIKQDLGYDPFRPEQDQAGNRGPNSGQMNGNGPNGGGPMGGGPNGGGQGYPNNGGRMGGGGPMGGGPMGGGPNGGGPNGGGPGGF